jgi:hypothetical protein
VQNPVGIRPLGRSRKRWEDIIKKNMEEISNGETATENNGSLCVR